MRPLHSGLSLRPLGVEEPDYIRPLAASCFPRPQLYVKEHLAPARYLSFQLGLKGVPLAQEETINLLLPGLRAWGSTEQVVDLASGPLF